MTANVDGMIRAGVEAYKKGDKAEARTLLERAIELDDHNEMAWLWLSAVVSNQDEQRTCLENVLVINPRNERAREGLKSLGVDPDMVAPPPEPSGSAPAFVDDYQVPSSSASTDYGGQEPSGDDYDSWVDNLGIGTSDQASQPQSASPFTETDFAADEGYDFDDSLFDDSPTTSAESSAPAFDFGDFNSEEFDTIDPDPAPPAAPTPAQDNFLDVDALFEDDDAAAVIGDSIDEDLASYVDDELLSPVSERPARSAPMPDDDVDIAALFSRIPMEIEATRLPGTRVGATPMSYVMLAILVLMNIGAIGLLVMQVIG
jgi:tetratricopeptide (TPR) repeat protein